MTLLRGFGQVDNDGKIALGRNFMLQMGLQPGSLAGLKVNRITGSGRAPYLIIHKPDKEPRFTALDTIFYQCPCRIDSGSCIILDDKVMAESGFEPGISLEFKLAGPQNAQRLVIRNRGPKRLTTLQERMGVRQKKRWKTMTMDY
ncbi:MAG: hypothetical protein L6302_07680 [Desulfobacteraceae bacterium]|nr:hypothetical protein [Desulfobacteraceae bacterium]